MTRILIVDDDPGARELLAEFVSGKGYTALMAEDGPTALRVLKDERPHVVFLDIMMPGMDGLTVLEKIREIDKEVGVIMVTAIHEADVGRQALQRGAFDFITKPIDFTYLENSLWYKITSMLL